MLHAKKMIVLIVLIVFSMETQSREKIIFGRVDWYPISEANKSLQRVGRAVGELKIPEARSRCTGFFVKPDIVMSAWHCVRNKFWARDVKIIVDSDTQIICDKFIKGDPYWDYVLLKCRRSHTTHIKLKRIMPVKNTPVYIIHNNCDYRAKSCRPQKIVSYDWVKNIYLTAFSYRADTLGGSSGAPVLNSKFKLTGIHTSGTSTENMGTVVARINNLPSWVYSD